MPNPKITVLTCAYNEENFISEAMESILRQSYNDFEYLIVDDGSTDGTRDIIKQYANRDNRLRLVEKSHTGLTDSLNCGLQSARGTWIARLDADDVALRDRLNLQIRHVSKYNNLVLIGGGCIEIDLNGTHLKEHLYPHHHKEIMARLEKRKAIFPHSSAFFSREYAINLGGYNPRFIRSQDLDFWLRIGESGTIGCIAGQVVYLRRHPQSLSSTLETLQPVLGMSAVICHLRRKSGVSDPSQLEESVWKGFTSWVKKRMEELGYFRYLQALKAFRKTRYSFARKNRKITYLKNLILWSISDPPGLIRLYGRYRFRDLPRRLAHESLLRWRQR
jgi:glycosyltransferase involved in cell wall biosynthesis